ncbi:MAG: hypothetical protein B6244_08040 [Candidatus Cloacimonetes bacterium 4572_55]|nr:MAG: hypothetical protein B6244_08040 [Candidatus Cloacimonetes bacterium 4572_55]
MSHVSQDYHLVHVGCSQCGASLQLEEGSRVGHCPYCGNFSLFVGREGALQYYVRHKIGSKDAQKIVRDRLKAVTKNEKLGATMQSMQLYYVPYWRLHGTILGWVFGREPVKRSETIRKMSSYDGSGYSYLKTVQKIAGDQGVEKLVRRSGVINISACDISEMGIESLDSRHQAFSSYMGIHQKYLGDMSLLDLSSQKEGIFLDITVPLEKAKEDAEEFHKKLIQGVTFRIKVTYQTFRMVTKQVSLVYYPIWFCRYSVYGRQFTATVDACNRRVIAGVSPPETRVVSIKAIFFLIIAANFIVTPFIRIFIFPFFKKNPQNVVCLTVLIVALVLIGVCKMAWLHFILTTDTNLAERKEIANSSISMS